MRRKLAGRGPVVADDVPRGIHRPGLPDVDPDDLPRRPPGQPPRLRRGPIVGEAHRVQKRPVAGQPPHPRPLVARLGEVRRGPDLDRPEAERPEPLESRRVLVDPGRQAQGSAELEPESADPEARRRAQQPVGERHRSRDPREDPHRRDRQ